MSVQWDDNNPHQFLKEFSTRSSRLFRICAEAELRFKMVPADSIVRKGDIAGNKHYIVHPERVVMYQRRIRKGEKIGTLFCRQLEDKVRNSEHFEQWFLKDGNHRFLACQAEGISEVRIAYDVRNRV